MSAANGTGVAGWVDPPLPGSCDGQERVTYVKGLLLELAGLCPDGDDQDGIFGESEFRLPGVIGACPEDLTRVFDAVSLKREMETGRSDKHGRFPDSAISWDLREPWVSRMAARLSGALAQGEVGPSGSRNPLRVVITHDVDWVTPTNPVSFLKALAGRKAGGQPTWLSVKDTLKPSLFLHNLESLLELERRLGVHSWFFFLGGGAGFGRYSSRYRTRSSYARRYIAMVGQAGAEIGLHGSYHARERNSYTAEVALLSEVAGRPVLAHRSHYLRFDPKRLWSQLGRAGIGLDFSLCFSERMGFRVPVTGPFHPYDWTTLKASGVRAIPTIAMDRVWWPCRKAEVLADLKVLLQAAGEVGGAVALLIHPEIMVLDPRWFGLFEDIVEVCREAEAVLNTTTEDLMVADGAGGRGERWGN